MKLLLQNKTKLIDEVKCFRVCRVALSFLELLQNSGSNNEINVKHFNF